MRLRRTCFLRFSFLSLFPGSRQQRLKPRRASTFEMDRFFIAGFQHHDGPRFLEELALGQDLTIVREPFNPHDSRAVALCLRNRRIGYVPMKRNHAIARLVDQEAPLTCRVTAVDRCANLWEAVEVSIAIDVPKAETIAPVKKRWWFGISFGTRESVRPWDEVWT